MDSLITGNLIPLKFAARNSMGTGTQTNLLQIWKSFSSRHQSLRSASTKSGGGLQLEELKPSSSVYN